MGGSKNNLCRDLELCEDRSPFQGVPRPMHPEY